MSFYRKVDCRFLKGYTMITMKDMIIGNRYQIKVPRNNKFPEGAILDGEFIGRKPGLCVFNFDGVVVNVPPSGQVLAIL